MALTRAGSSEPGSPHEGTEDGVQIQCHFSKTAEREAIQEKASLHIHVVARRTGGELWHVFIGIPEFPNPWRGLNAILRVPGMMQCFWALLSCSPVALSHQGRMAEPRPAAELPGFIPFPPLTCRLLRAFQALQPCAHRGERSRKHLRCAGPCRLAPAPSASL